MLKYMSFSVISFVPFSNAIPINSSAVRNLDLSKDLFSDHTIIPKTLKNMQIRTLGKRKNTLSMKWIYGYYNGFCDIKFSKIVLMSAVFPSSKPLLIFAPVSQYNTIPASEQSHFPF